jgi:hypothetical protein
MIAMLRPATWFWLALVAVVGYAMFEVKHQVMQLEDRLARVNHDIDANRAETRVLEAEWSTLNKPERLDQLRKRYLPNLQPLAGNNYGTLDQVPFRNGEQASPPAGSATPNAQPAPSPSQGPSIALPGGPSLASVKPGAIQ